jgi:hypothetical protein
VAWWHRRPCAYFNAQFDSAGGAQLPDRGQVRGICYGRPRWLQDFQRV